MIDRRYWITDEMWLVVNGSASFRSYLDSDKLAYLKRTKINRCPFCDGDLYREFSSYFCGHGESNQTIRYRCFGCTLDITESYGYGRGFDACDDSFMEKTKTIIDVILRRHNYVYSNSLQEE